MSPADASATADGHWWIWLVLAVTALGGIGLALWVAVVGKSPPLLTPDEVAQLTQPDRPI